MNISLSRVAATNAADENYPAQSQVNSMFIFLFLWRDHEITAVRLSNWEL